MDSSISFEWRKPVVFDRELVDKLTAAAEDFRLTIIADILAEAGLSVIDYPDADSLMSKYREDRQENDKFFALSHGVERLGNISWTARLADNTVVQPGSGTELIAMHNVGSSAVQFAGIQLGALPTYFSVTFEGGRSRHRIEIKISGSLSRLQNLKREVETILLSKAQGWWRLRWEHYDILGFVLISLLSIVSYMIIELKPPPEISPTTRTDAGLALFASFVIGFLIITGTLARFMRWAFPLIDFSFAGGVQTSRTKTNFRRALWFIPIMGVAIPFMVNKLSAI